ncbi:MAG TPA: acyl-CoA dehydrogenase family protein [Kineosporiaceae bacterium]
MHVTLTETEQAVVQAARAVIEGTGLPAGDLPGTPPAEWAEPLWKALAQAGLLGLAAPASLGGDGLGVPEVLALLTELGRAAAVGPALATLALGVLPTSRWATPAQQRALLVPVLEAGAVLTAAVHEPAHPLGVTGRPVRPVTTVTAALVVRGVKVAVPYVERAHRVLVPVTSPDGVPAVAIVDPGAPGVRAVPTPTSAGWPEHTLYLDGVVADGLLGDRAGTAAGQVVADLCRLALAGTCAVADGLVRGALELTAAHVRSRQQFGRPLATFQAVALQIADVYLAARTLHLASRSAADGLGDPGGPGTGRDLAVAAYWLARYGPPALRTCHQLHGGLGLDVTYPLHRYSAHLRDLVRATGGTEHCLDRLAELEG